METIIKNRPQPYIGEKMKAVVTEITVSLFILLFMYTASGKIFSYEDFDHVLYILPIFGPYHQLIAITIISSELIISALLIIPRTRKTGLYGTLVLMIIFTVYLIYMVNFEFRLPCSCGGIISDLSWTNHIWLNVLLTVLVSFCLLTYQNKDQKL